MENTDFLPLQRTDASAESVYVARPSAWYRLQQNKLALVGLGIIVVMIILAIVGPMFSSYTYAEQDLMAANQGPSSAHWFGTDTLGRDLYTRVMYGARISLTIGFVAALINLVIGVIYGGVSSIEKPF